MRKIKKETPHLDYYKKCMKKGGRLLRIERGEDLQGAYTGLCQAAMWGPINSEILDKYIAPRYREKKALEREGLDSIYWGSGECGPAYGKLTPLRQNLVLIMAAINEEF